MVRESSRDTAAARSADRSRWHELSNTPAALQRLLCAGPLLAGAALASGQHTIHVAPCGDDAWSGLNPACAAPDGPKRTIQAGVNAAQAGDTVLVEDGTYSEFVDVPAVSMTLRSVGGAAGCILRAPGHTQVSHVLSLQGHAAASVVVDGLTITGGYLQIFGLGTVGGAGAYITNGNDVFQRCVFSGNFVDGGGFGGALGGGVYVSGGVATFDSCSFLANGVHANIKGSGAVGGAAYGPARFTNCRFSNNGASISNASPNGVGGALAGGSTCINCVLTGNTAGAGGAAVGGSFVNCTFTGNAGDEGPALVGGVALNCIFWHNTGSQAGPVYQSTVTYSDVQGGYAGSGNINSDPLLITMPDGNLVLGAGSPCIDAGSNALPPSVTRDYSGAPRFQDDPATPDTGVGVPPLVDMGANEFPGVACYANCDGSTNPPVLSVADFMCFEARFAAGDRYTNCDGSSLAPVLNVNDFICFQLRFVGGCP